jgi:signal transduction histidine kinase
LFRLLLSATSTMPTEIHADHAYSTQWRVQGELNRLAAEIHDGLTQHLSAIHLQLLAAEELISSTGDDALRSIRQAIELTNLGLAEARRCAYNLHRSEMEESGLQVAIRQLAERWTVPGRLRCDFRSNKLPEEKLSSAIKHQLLRIAQEAVHNAARHGNPTLVSITLRWNTSNISLEVRDNGAGMAADKLAKSNGFGLGNMRGRARDIDGRMRIKTAPGQGTIIIVTVPVAQGGANGRSGGNKEF